MTTRKWGPVYSKATPAYAATCTQPVRPEPTPTPQELKTRVHGDEIAFVYQPKILKRGREYWGGMIAGLHWTDFTIRLKDFDRNDEDLNRIQTRLNELYNQADVPSLKARELWTVGMPCAARYTDDNKWYRGRLEDLDYGIVRFVDYGNVQICDPDDIKPLTKTLAEISPPTGFRCTLTGDQDRHLPSYKDQQLNVCVTILSSSEPYEVAVLNPSRQVSGLFAEMSETIKPDCGGKGDNPRSNLCNGTMNGHDSNSSKASSSKGEKDMIRNQVGMIEWLDDTRATVQLHSHPPRSIFINAKSLFHDGSLRIASLRRIFELNERISLTARKMTTIEAQINSQMDINGRGSAFKSVHSPTWLVTNFSTSNNDQSRPILIDHAIVTYVVDSGCILYARRSRDFVWASKIIFPDDIAQSPASLKELVNIGRSVLVRALPSALFLDFKMDVHCHWVAVGVELIDTVKEGIGWMMLVTETYSIIVDDSDTKLGYIFTPNQLVEANDVPMDNWYGCRVKFQACIDAVDKRSRWPINARALRATLDLSEPKGIHLHTGIRRRLPAPANLLDDAPSCSSSTPATVSQEDFFMNMPEEIVRELEILGRDTIGVQQQRQYVYPQGVKEVKDNLVNQWNETKTKAFGPTLLDLPNDGLHQSTVEIEPMPVSPKPKRSTELPLNLGQSTVPKKKAWVVNSKRVVGSQECGCQTDAVVDGVDMELARKDALDDLVQLHEEEESLERLMTILFNIQQLHQKDRLLELLQEISKPPK